MHNSKQVIYNVHLYREMRLFFPGIEAASPEAAARAASAKVTSEADAILDCDGTDLAALVDIVGVTDYSGSRVIDFESPYHLPILRAILEALQAARDHMADSLDASDADEMRVF